MTLDQLVDAIKTNPVEAWENISPHDYEQVIWLARYFASNYHLSEEA